MSILATRKPERKPRKKPARRVRLLVPLNAQGDNGVVRIAVGATAADYLVARLPADFGEGFELSKVGDAEGTTYHVHLGGDGNTCTCPGGSYAGHCKHADGLAALKAAGRL